MANFKVVLTKQAVKDRGKIAQFSTLVQKTANLIKIIAENPFEPPYEKLIGELDSMYSRRINKQHRLVYKIFEKEKIVKILSMWTHYENI